MAGSSYARDLVSPTRNFTKSQSFFSFAAMIKQAMVAMADRLASYRVGCGTAQAVFAVGKKLETASKYLSASTEISPCNPGLQNAGVTLFRGWRFECRDKAGELNLWDHASGKTHQPPALSYLDA